MKRCIFFCCTLLTFCARGWAQDLGGFPRLTINEVLASNSKTNASPDFREYADWLELYNDESVALDLSGYFLTDNLSSLQKWAIPAGTLIPAKGFLLIWADDRNTGLHANFKISADGEALGLAFYGTLVDSVIFGKQTADVSLGRSPDGGSYWLTFTKPTPGARNSASGYFGRAAPPNFSRDGGFYSGAQTITISTQDADGTLHYTLDGSIPDAQAALYQTPLFITATTVVRAVVRRPGYLDSRVTTHTYFIDEFISLPVVSVATNPANLWDDKIGIYVIGTNGIVGYCSNQPRNWNQPWEKPVSFELYEADGGPGFKIDAGMRIGGGCTRLYPEKPLAFYTRSEYGFTEINYRLFTDKPMTRYNNVLLRNGGQDWWRAMFRDGMMHTLVKNRMDIDWIAYRPAILFLNGAYWGIHDLREKHNEHYIAGNYNIDPDQIDILADNASVEQGSATHYKNMIRYLETQDITQPAHYAWVCTQMDMNEYIDYQIAEIYFANIDWPGGNIEFWRQQGDGHKWRWILYDTDLGFGAHNKGQYDSNTLENATAVTSTYYANPGWSTFLLRTLLQNRSFRDEFIQRFAGHLNTTFAPVRVLAIIDSLRDQIAPEIPRHIEKWPQSTSFNGGWAYHLDVMNEFAAKRPEHVRAHIAGKFALQGTAALTLQTEPAAAGCIVVNGIPMPCGEFQGIWFKGVSLAVQARASHGYRFAGWQGAYTASLDSIGLMLSGDATLTARFERDEAVVYQGLRINEIMALNSKTRADEYGEYDDWIELYNDTPEPVNVGGMYISDNLSSLNKWQIPATAPHLTTIAPGGFLLLWADGTPSQGVLHLDFKLSGDGEEIGLSRAAPDGIVLVDEMVFPAQKSDVSWGRMPDGAETMGAMSTPTPGYANAVTGVAETGPVLPVTLHLHPNYPNPFNAQTTVPYELDRAGRVRLSLFDAAGREVRVVRDRWHTAGRHTVSVDAAALPSGLYFIRLESGAVIRVQKTALIR